MGNALGRHIYLYIYINKLETEQNEFLIILKINHAHYKFEYIRKCSHDK
mgnify:CR=1 FL=1